MMSKSVKIIDTSLRDGSHAVHHTHTPETVAAVCAGLEKAGAYGVEVGHGGGLNGSLLLYGLGTHSDQELLCAARKELHHTKLFDLFVPGIATMRDMQYAQENYGLDGVRHNLRVLRNCNLEDTRLIIGDKALGMVEAIGQVFPHYPNL